MFPLFSPSCPNQSAVTYFPSPDVTTLLLNLFVIFTYLAIQMAATKMLLAPTITTTALPLFANTVVIEIFREAIT